MGRRWVSGRMAALVNLHQIRFLLRSELEERMGKMKGRVYKGDGF